MTSVTRLTIGIKSDISSRFAVNQFDREKISTNMLPVDIALPQDRLWSLDTLRRSHDDRGSVTPRVATAMPPGTEGAMP